MKKNLGLACLAIVGAVQLSHASFGRDKVESLWPDKPVLIDGRAVEWSEMPVLEESGISFRAMNDASSLYLLIRGTASDGRVLLSGKYRQNVTLWFLKPDHKTRAWGINLDFSRAHPAAEEAPPVLASLGMEPEMILPQGLEISTAAFPSDFEFQADLSSQRGRQPIYEIRIPLSMIEHNGKLIFIDFVTSEVSPEIKAELQSDNNEAPAAAPAAGGGRHKHGGSHGAGGAAPSVEAPKPLDLQLTVALTKKPKH